MEREQVERRFRSELLRGIFIQSVIMRYLVLMNCFLARIGLRFRVWWIWRPIKDHWFVLSWPSKNFQRLYLYAGWWGVKISNNWGGQLRGYFRAGLFVSQWWKYGVRGLWQYDVQNDD